MKKLKNKRSKQIKFYNSIIFLIENGKYNYGKRELEKYINHFSDDECAILKYVELLISDEEYEKALEICENFLCNPMIKYQYAIINKRINNNDTAKRIFLELYKMGNSDALIQLITILVREGDFALAHKYYLMIDYEYIDSNTKKIELLKRTINKRLYPELNDIMKHENLPYFSAQIVNYDERKLINRLNNYDYGFNPNINPAQLIGIIKSRIEDKEPYEYESFDKYIIYFKGIAVLNGKRIDHLKVLTNLNTKEIVNFYPTKCRNYSLSRVKEKPKTYIYIFNKDILFLYLVSYSLL